MPLYKALMRFHLEYCPYLLFPVFKKEFKQEEVQKRDSKIIRGMESLPGKRHMG